MTKVVAAALKAVQDLVFETADLDAQLKQVTGKLVAAGIGLGPGSIIYAGRDNLLGAYCMNVSVTPAAL